MIVGFIVITIVGILFPIFFTVNMHINLLTQKIYFSFYILKFIKIYGGYATLYDKGMAFHLTKKKAVLLPYNEMHNGPKKFEITKGFYMLAYAQNIEVGIQENLGQAIILVSAIEAISTMFANYFFTRKKCQSFKTNMLLNQTKNAANATLRLILVFNVVILSIAFVKLILEKILKKKEEKNERKKIYQ